MPVATEKAVRSPADVLTYCRDLVSTGKFLPLGRMRTIAVGPCASFEDHKVKHPEILSDPYICGYGPQPQRNARGRMIDLTGQWLSIGQDVNSGMILVTSPLRDRNGYVALPDLVDPLWRAPEFTSEEVQNPDCDANCLKQWDPLPDGKRTLHVHVNLRGDKDSPQKIPQRLEDRTADALAGTNYLVFQPVERITYQPEDMKGGEHKFQPAEWKIRFIPDGSGKQCAFLCDMKTGECHFFGGVAMLEGDTRG